MFTLVMIVSFVFYVMGVLVGKNWDKLTEED